MNGVVSITGGFFTKMGALFDAERLCRVIDSDVVNFEDAARRLSSSRFPGPTSQFDFPDDVRRTVLFLSGREHHKFVQPIPSWDPEVLLPSRPNVSTQSLRSSAASSSGQLTCGLCTYASCIPWELTG